MLSTDIKTYDFYKARGLCVQCGDQAEPGSVYCWRHRMDAKIAKRNRYARCVESHICYCCGQEIHGASVMCPICAKKDRDRHKRLREERTALHQCWKCGRPMPASETHKKCEWCRARENRYKQERRNAA